MMAHMASVEKIVEQAKLFESYGAEVIYVTDSAGYMLPKDVTDRISALKQSVGCEIGFHGHNNLSMAMANTVAAVEAGATYIDGSLRALGAGSGNTQTEVMVAVLERLGYQTGIDLYKIMDVANDVVAKYMQRPQEITGSSLIMGYSGVYSSFLFIHRLPPNVLVLMNGIFWLNLGRMKAVGGQEDLIYDVAQRLAVQI